MLSEAAFTRLRDDTVAYCRECVQVVNEDRVRVPLIARPAQLKLERALQAQHAKGLPMRAVVLKSRKVGISTWVQAKILQRTTLLPNREALVVAQDNKTAGKLFDIAKTAWRHLPAAKYGDPRLKPKIVGESDTPGRKYMHFGEPSRLRRQEGDVGVDSRFEIDTAKEVDAGRGETISELHASEVAYWRDIDKWIGLMNAVPDRYGSLVVVESTAKGHNEYKGFWDQTVKGLTGYVWVFIGWPEDENCTRPFPDPDARERFLREEFGKGEWGADEPRLVERHGVTPEQLHWRRITIAAKCAGKLALFKQEYPSFPQEAFVGSGKHVFSIQFVQNAVEQAEAYEAKKPAVDDDGMPIPGKAGGPQQGILIPSGTETRKLRGKEVEVPTGAAWVPRSKTGFGDEHPWWTIWEGPVTAETEAHKPPDDRLPVGQYIEGVDPAGGDENINEVGANHAIEIVSHRTLEQVAEFASRDIDPDELAEQAFLAALFWNRPWMAVEKTGGYGLSIIRRVRHEFGYPLLYRVPKLDVPTEKAEKRYGWDTNMRTKPLMEDRTTRLLREGSHGIRSLPLALEFTTYVVDDRGRHVPDAEAFADRLMAWQIAQAVADEKHLRPDKKPGQRAVAPSTPQYPIYRGG